MNTRHVFRGILLAAAFPFHAGAGTLFYVPISARDSDAQSGIASANRYTSAIAAGRVKPTAPVNGAEFAPLSAADTSASSDGVTLSAATGALANGGGQSETIAADGAMRGLFSRMIFNDGAGDNSEQYLVLDPATLAAGKTYDLRVYVCNSSGENRQVALTFAGDGKPAVGTDFFNEDDATTSAGGFDDPNEAYYINFRFTWDGVSTPGFTALQKHGGTPFCLYAVTNQEVTTEEDARPAGAVVVQPDPIAEAPRATPRALLADTDDDIGVASDVFYAAPSLRDHGQWVKVGSYGRCWHPTDVDNDWRPYTRGHWVWSNDDGWVWDSDEDFGWATYHYGRWFREEGSGWYWVPGRRWAPAWVSWRHGHSHVGWAPLPPVALVTAGIGIGVWADHRWGIGPNAYNFVSTRNLSAPVLASVIVPRAQNPALMSATSNVTNIAQTHHGIFNGGPNFHSVNNALVRAGAAPILTASLTRNAGSRPVTPDGKYSHLSAGVLSMAAPTVTKNKKNAPLPTAVATIAAPKFDKGWSGITDPRHATALQAKVAAETPSNAAKNAPAHLPGSVHVARTSPTASTGATPATPGNSGTLKPFRSGKNNSIAHGLPGQPAAPAAVVPLQPAPGVAPAVPGVPAASGTPAADVSKSRSGRPKFTGNPNATVPTAPGVPVAPTVMPVKPGVPVAGTDTPSGKTGVRVKPGAAVPTAPATPTTPATTGNDQPKNRSGRPKVAVFPTPNPGTPTTPDAPAKPAASVPVKPHPSVTTNDNPPSRPGQRVKPGVVAPPSPVPAPVAAQPTPPPQVAEPARGKKFTQKPAPTPAPAPVVRPATAPVVVAPTPEPMRVKKQSPPATPPSAPVARPNIPAAPEPARPAKHMQPAQTPAPAPVARPQPAPAPAARSTPMPRPLPAPVVVPPRPAPAAPPSKPQPAPAATKGGRPTPTPIPG